MSYMFAIGICRFCHQSMHFNPYRVPSLDDQPICQNCMRRINKLRILAGAPEIKVPPDAYKSVEVE